MTVIKLVERRKNFRISIKVLKALPLILQYQDTFMLHDKQD